MLGLVWGERNIRISIVTIHERFVMMFKFYNSAESNIEEWDGILHSYASLSKYILEGDFINLCWQLDEWIAEWYKIFK